MTAPVLASIVTPCVIQQVGTFIRMIFGELDGKRSKRTEDFLALYLKARLPATLSELFHLFAMAVALSLGAM